MTFWPAVGSTEEDRVGAVLSITAVALGPAPASGLPAASVEALATEIPMLPSPLMEDNVTVQVEPAQLIEGVADTPPVTFKVKSARVKPIEVAPL